MNNNICISFIFLVIDMYLIFWTIVNENTYDTRESFFLISSLHIPVYKTEEKNPSLFTSEVENTSNYFSSFFKSWCKQAVSIFLLLILNQIVNLASDVTVPKQNGEKLKILQLPMPAGEAGGRPSCLMYPRKCQPSVSVTNLMKNLQWEVRASM